MSQTTKVLQTSLAVGYTRYTKLRAIVQNSIIVYSYDDIRRVLADLPIILYERERVVIRLTGRLLRRLFLSLLSFMTSSHLSTQQRDRGTALTWTSQLKPYNIAWLVTGRQQWYSEIRHGQYLLRGRLPENK